jgi:hypothetical protein
MTSKEFAEANAGRRCKNSICGLGRIVGYNGNHYIVVEFENQHYSWGTRSEMALWCKFVVSDVKWGYNVHPENIELLPDDKPTALIVSVSPYPSSCKHCHSPSRKLAALTLCSNSKCKSRKLLSSIYKGTKQINYHRHTKMLSDGVHVAHLEIWSMGGCVLCGGEERDGQSWAHDDCWDRARGMTFELQNVCRDYRIGIGR